MYPIQIKSEAQTVRYTRVFELEDHILTLSIIQEAQITPNETFSIHEVYSSQFPSYQLIISGVRLESEIELFARIQKESEYMKEYNKRKAG